MMDISGERTECPLCQSQLSNEFGSQESFPEIPIVYKQFNLFFRVMIFISVILAITTVSINLLLPDTGKWSIFIITAIACIWIILASAINKRKNIPKNLISQTVLISIISVAWDYFTGWKNWSIDYVIPLLCISIMIALGILTYVLKWGIANIAIYIVIDAVFGIIPIIFYILDLLTIHVVSIICISGSIISIAAIIVFRGEILLIELKRRLHL
jgi:hypothetical protein